MWDVAKRLRHRPVKATSSVQFRSSHQNIPRSPSGKAGDCYSPIRRFDPYPRSKKRFAIFYNIGDGRKIFA
jgi:hypothetical protein